MKTQRKLGTHNSPLQSGRQREHGLSLIEMAVAMGVGSIVLVVLGLLSLDGMRSFLVMGNCAALDQNNRFVSDRITRDVRQATRILKYQSDAEGKTLVLTNSLQGHAITYAWDAATRTVTSTLSDELPITCLKDCDSWEALFFQNLPQTSATAPFLPATNGAGSLDLDGARVVTLSWKCSRPVVGASWKTESAQRLQIALRNTAQP